MSEQGAVATLFNSQRAEKKKTINDETNEILTELRQQGNLCDAVIRVGDVEFNIHKIILCGCSSYFCTLFTGAWATQGKPMHTIIGVTPDIIELVIGYAYTRSIPLTNENVVEALAAADRFLISGMVQACCLFFEDHLCLKNCLSTWKLMDFYNCTELRNKVFLYILKHFEELVSVKQELLDLSVQQLTFIIENDYLNVKKEDTVFAAILCWINQLPQQRQSYISLLLPKVRLGLMSAEYLQISVLENALIKNNNECIPIINDAVAALNYLRHQGHSETFYQNLLSRPRLPHSILLVTGGTTGIIPTTSLEAYDSRADRWVSLTTAAICPVHHAAASLFNFVYLIGGCYQGNHLNSVLKFDLLNFTWHHVASMNAPRSYLSVAVLNGRIIAMGGFSGQTYLNSVESYDPEKNQWTMVASMGSKRVGASATTLNGKIYICGGCNGRHSIKLVEFYNPDNNTWTSISSMRTFRHGLCVAAYKGHIYAVGGTLYGSTNVCLCTVEAYNPQTNRWRQLPSMCKARSYCGMEVVDDQLFVVGGHDGSNRLPTVERYDIEAGLWFSAAPTETPRSGLSCCVLQGLQSLAENLFTCGPLMYPNAEEAGGGTI